MRKVMTVILWLGLAVCLVRIFSLAGQRSALQREMKEETLKNEVLQTLYDQKKEEWDEKEAALTREKNELAQNARLLTLERDALAEALQAAEMETQAQRRTADALTAERETASGRLSEVLSMLRSPVPELSVEENGQDNLFEQSQPAPSLPVRGPQPVAFGA